MYSNFLKIAAFIFVAFLYTNVINAQIYERGKKNFFIEPTAYLNFSNANKKAYTGHEKSMSFSLTGGKVFMGWLKTGLTYNYNNFTFNYSDTLTTNKANAQTHYAGIRTDIMIPIMASSMGKSKNYECRSLTNFIFIGPEYGMHFGTDKANIYKINPSAFSMNFAWGMIFKNSGSRKKQAAFDLYIMLNLKRAFANYMTILPTNQKIYPTYWGISLVLVKYKVGKWA